MSAVAEAVRIDLEGSCLAGCEEFSSRLFEQLTIGYERCSVLQLGDVQEWRSAHRTARRRANRARNRGYRFAAIERWRHNEEIYEINTSLTERQGRPMSAGYREQHVYTPDRDECDRHGVYAYGVLDSDYIVRAYLWLYRSGDLALVSSILGHGDHLANDVMYLLVEGTIADQDDGLLVYNRADSGTEGLRYFKERLGFEATAVEWAL